MKQSFSALKHIHAHRISHRYVSLSIGSPLISVIYSDIKPENFMLKNKDDITNIKIIDFGLSRDFSEEKAMQNPIGSVIYFVT